MPSCTSEVSTVPGTTAACQPLAENSGAEISAIDCGTLAASCSCQPEPISTAAGSEFWACADQPLIHAITTASKANCAVLSNTDPNFIRTLGLPSGGNGLGKIRRYCPVQLYVEIRSPDSPTST